jgi:hypothetical protein
MVPVGSLGVVSMTSMRLALGIGLGLTISAAAWGLAQNKDPGQDPVARPPTAPAPAGPTESAGFGSDRASPSASPSAPPSGTASAPLPSATVAIPRLVHPPLATRVPRPAGSRVGPPEQTPGRFTARFSFSSTWSDGFLASVDLVNSTDQEQTWEVRLTFPDGVTVPDGTEWNATKTGTTGTLVFTGKAVPAGDALAFGFQAAKTAPNRKDFEPTACTLNGVECEKF